MNVKLLRNAVLGTVLLAGMAGAETGTAPLDDNQIGAKVLHEIRMYPRYSVFDDVKFRVSNGTVFLLGEVTQPFKKSDLANIVKTVPGITAVNNDLRVAPLSPFDDSLRMQVANSIYRDPVLSRYGLGALPSIHIVVDSGHVTLEGMVDSEAAKNLAGMRANSSLSLGTVTNNLQVVNPQTGSL